MNAFSKTHVLLKHSEINYLEVPSAHDDKTFKTGNITYFTQPTILHLEATTIAPMVLRVKTTI